MNSPETGNIKQVCSPRFNLLSKRGKVKAARRIGEQSVWWLHAPAGEIDPLQDVG